MADVAIRNLSKRYSVNTGFIAQLRGRLAFADAVNDVSLDIRHGEVTALVGESGCGKTTLGKMLVKLEAPTSGSILIDGRDVAQLRSRELRRFRSQVQMIFQDPYDSLNPQKTIRDIVSQPLRYLGIGRTRQEREERVERAMEQVELKPVDRYLSRLPHQLSGGQRQRVAIARALVVEPAFIVADEPVSMLDVSVRASILNLLRKLNHDLKIPILLITHDLSTAGFLADRIVVMYLGKIVEAATPTTLLRSPVHPYTKLLLSSVPRLKHSSLERLPLDGEVPNALNPPTGCRFHPRCPLATQKCREEVPELKDHDGHRVACHHASPSDSLEGE